MDRITKKIKSTSGFSFIEVLIVVAIIGILMAIAIPSYQWIIKDAKQTKMDVAIARVVEAKSQFYQNKRTINPPELADLVPYLNIKPGIGTNAFYNVKGSLFEGCFANKETVFLNPRGPGEKPRFEGPDGQEIN